MMVQKKYIRSVLNNSSLFNGLDVRPSENQQLSPNPFFFELNFYNKRDLKLVKKKGFSSSIGKEIMGKIEGLDTHFGELPILLFDDPPYLLAQAVWQHFKPTHSIFIYSGGMHGLLLEAENLFKSPFKFHVLFGETGVGKTMLLRELARNGQQILDLEHIARHNGSTFGNLRKESQPSQETFLLEIAKTLAGFDKCKPVFVESETSSIGKNIIPLALTEGITKGARIKLTLTKKDRIERLVSEYAGVNDIDLKSGVEKLSQRLGKSTTDRINHHLAKKEYHQAAELLMVYFDNSSSYQISENDVFELVIDNQDVNQTAIHIIEKFG